MFSFKVTGEKDKDISNVVVDDDTQTSTELENNEQLILNELYEKFGTKQLTRKKFDSEPPWLLDKAMKVEFEENWKDAVEEVKPSSQFTYRKQNQSRGERQAY